MTQAKEVYMTAHLAPPTTMPTLMPMASGPVAWWKRTRSCVKQRHTPIYSSETNNPAKTRYCLYCGTVLEQRMELNAERPRYLGRELHEYGTRLLAMGNQRAGLNRKRFETFEEFAAAWDWGSPVAVCEHRTPIHPMHPCLECP